MDADLDAATQASHTAGGARVQRQMIIVAPPGSLPAGVSDLASWQDIFGDDFEGDPATVGNAPETLRHWLRHVRSGGSGTAAQEENDGEIPG
jgi:hypothetical protein